MKWPVADGGEEKVAFPESSFKPCRKKIAVEFLESEGHAAEEPVPQPPPEPVLEIKIAHFCGETIDEIQQLLCDLGEFLTVEAVDQKGDFARCLSAAIQSHLR